VGVGSLAPWRVGPPEQAAAGVEPPTHGARDRARWARHGWAAWAGAGGDAAGVRWAATSARTRGGRGRPRSWELGRAHVGPGGEEGALGRAGGGGGEGEGNRGGPTERAREGEGADFPFYFLYPLLLFQFDIM
jgi:hypothetical protein